MALALSVLLLTAASAMAEDDLLAKIQNRGSLIIATEGNWKPWTYHDDSDQLTGYDVEVGRLIAEKLGVKAEYRETEWSALLAGVDSGLFDIACNGVDYTEERAEKYAFSDPYVYTEIALVVRKDNEDIHSFADLAGKVTSNSPSSTYAQRAEAAGASVVYVDAFDGTMMMVEQGRAEASINALGTIEEYLEEKLNNIAKQIQKLYNLICQNDNISSFIKSIWIDKLDIYALLELSPVTDGCAPPSLTAELYISSGLPIFWFAVRFSNVIS